MNRDIRFTVQIEDNEFEDVEFAAGGDGANQPTMQTQRVEDSEVDQSPAARQPIDATKGFRPKLRAPIAELQVFYDNQRQFQSVPLVKDRTVIGRTTGDVTIQHDRMISSKHAEILREEADGVYRWRLRDLKSTNGMFINIDRAKLRSGDEILMGSHRYRLISENEQHRLQMIESGSITAELVLPDDGICVGRDQSELMDCFWDDLLDPKHAFIRRDRQGTWSIKNLQSTNGIWYRVSELPLTRKCFFQIGEQRFGFRY